MGKSKLRGQDLLAIGFQEGKIIGLALNTMQTHFKKHSKVFKTELLTNLLANPNDYLGHKRLHKLAEKLIELSTSPILKEGHFDLKEQADSFEIYGKEGIAKNAIEQMKVAMRLPITVGGALMADAHQGYGLPIGGVLAAKNAVIPFGVGVDIGCRMCLTMYDMPISYLKGHHAQLKNYLMEHTRFGMGCSFKNPIDDEIFERSEFKEIDLAKRLKDKAYSQIGTSGGGNHFVEYGIVRIVDQDNEFNLPIGDYVGILSHSGSRGLGANIANFYTKLAMETCKLPKEARHLAWLDLDTEAGQEYWLAMNLAGDYASACHHQIHRRLGKAMGMKPLAMVENHHNFAWKEKLPNQGEVIVHRKGATPAGKGVLGIIPGSMTAPGFIVRGRGENAALNSASHGAGRAMSRRKAKESLTNSEVRKCLKQHGVTLIGGGIDEAPMAYKDINQVMGHQHALVDIIGSFSPKIVRMADD